MRDSIAIQRAAAEELGLEPSQVAIAATGKIGVALPVDDVVSGMRRAASEVRPDGGEEFAEAIMTTDAFPKRCTVRCEGVTLSAQAKGAGMIQPGFATMLCFVQTDATVEDAEAELRRAVSGSFERITVDGQMSTNDTVLLQASGEADRPLPDGLLDAVLLQLALEIVADGEGATRVGCVRVREAASEEEAERAARAIANSPLVKTALFGHDPNWGRIAQAAGMALAGEELEELGLDHIDADEFAADAPEAELSVRLGRGDAAAHVWFSDLGYEYVRINAEYTT
jgi:glutamate N-acetyltransferase/amino-acid N-acetyltransferase